MTDQIADPSPAGTISSVTLICGYSGSGKSSLLATQAEYVWEVHKKWSSYYLFDGGGIPTQVQALANKGIIRLWKVRTRTMEHGAPTTIYRAAQGWWPSRINPRTGEVDPAVTLVPPVTQTIESRCPNGHVKQTVRFQTDLVPGICATPGCNQPVNDKTWKLSHTSKVTKGFEQRGACLFDSIPGASVWLLEDLAQRSLGGEGTRLGGTVVSDGKQFGENNRGQVGFAQTSVRQWIGVGSGIPNLVVPPVWTALIKEATAAGSKDGETMGLKLRGPDIEAGTAKTATVPQWVGNCLEAAVVEHDGKKWRRLYLKSYVDSEGFFHPLKVRTYPGLLPAFLEDEDSDDPAQARFVNFSLSTFQKKNDEARVICEANLDKQYPDAPGLDGAGEFGDPADALPPPVVAVTPAALPVRGPVAVSAARPTPVPVKAPAAVVAAAVVNPPVGPPSQPTAASTGPVAPTPPVSRGPQRGPVAAPPGRRPTPVVK